MNEACAKKLRIIVLLLLIAVAFSLECGVARADTRRVTITFVYNARKYVYHDDLMYSDDVDVIQNIYDRKINQGYEAKMQEISLRLTRGADIITALDYCFPTLHRTIDEIIGDIERAPIDSEIDFSPDSTDMFKISGDKSGLHIDRNKLYMEVYYALLRSDRPIVRVIPERVAPSVTVRDNLAVTYLRARFVTDYSSGTDERKQNIRLALDKINGTVLDADEEFSFNATVGRRSEANGFLPAKIIVGGKYVDGIGGGVCQASTTLYNCALLSGLEVVEVHNHSLESSYIAPSFDAMVNSTVSDLKFVNISGGKIFIRAYGTESKVVVEIYGARMNCRIERVSEVVYRGELPECSEVIDTEHEYFDENATSGSKKQISYSHPEVHSKGFLRYYDLDGHLLSSKQIRADKYCEVVGVIAICP